MTQKLYIFWMWQLLIYKAYDILDNMESDDMKVGCYSQAYYCIIICEGVGHEKPSPVSKYLVV